VTERTADSTGPWSPRWASAVVFLGVAVVFAFGLGWLGLIEPDEARYAAVGRAMLDTGDFVTPRFNGFVYLDKPPALHWLTAASFAVLGPREFAARLFPMLAAAATVAVTYALGRQAFGHRAGLGAALVLTSSIMWFAVGRVLRYDMLLTLAITATLWWFWRASEAGPGGRGEYLLASAAAGFGVLVKGPVAVVLPFLILTAYLTLNRRLGTLRSMPWHLCLPVFLAIAAPWFVLCERANPGAVRFFLFHENIARAAGRTDATHWEPWWYFLAITALGIAPWTLLLPGAIADRCRCCRVEGGIEGRAGILLLVWAAIVVALFSIPKAKLPPYVLPAMPAVALLIGRYVADSRRFPYAAAATGLCLVAGGIALQTLGTEPTARAGVPPMPIVPFAATALVASGASASLFAHFRKPMGVVASIAAGALLLYHCVGWGATRLAKPPSDRAAVRRLAEYRSQGQQVICFRELSRGAVFYLNAPVLLIGNPAGEYDFPANAPHLDERVRDVEETDQLLAEAPPVVGLSRLRNWDDLLKRAPDRVEELERIGKHVIFRSVPAEPGP
jgi:4-amino-4-deoxy-L-arabinose transferase-like glycosyltransferase